MYGSAQPCMRVIGAPSPQVRSYSNKCRPHTQTSADLQIGPQNHRGHFGCLNPFTDICAMNNENLLQLVQEEEETKV